MASIKWLGKWLGGLVLTLLAFIMLTEAGARVFAWAPPPEADIGSVHVGYTPNGLGDFHPGQDGVYITNRAHPYYLHTNRDGFRSREEVSSSATRILALGNSQTFGLFVDSQDVWTDWLNFDLNHGFSSSKYQVLNNGIPGSSIVDQLEYFRDKGRVLGAKIVILAYNGDVSNMNRSESGRSLGMAVEQATRFNRLRWALRRHSAIYAVLKSVKERAMLDEIVNDNRSSSEVRQAELPFPAAAGEGTPSRAADLQELRRRYAQVFGIFAREVAASGAQLVVAVISSESADTTGFIRSLTTANGVALIDCTAALARRPTEEVYYLRPGDSLYPGDDHMTRTGHMLFAAEIARVLNERGLVSH